MFEISWPVIAGAFILDFLAGDLRNLPHPIVWMGNAISFFEPRFRRWIRSPFWAGLVFALVLVFFTFAIAGLVVYLGIRIHPLAGTGIQVVMLYYCFSAQSLFRAAMDVARPLMAGDISRARMMVGYIVGRETRTLDREGIARAACETVAENFVDGFLSPLFFALVLGVPGAMAYKMINTLDSMVGYKNKTYILFGRAAARIDDMANYIPARLSVLVISFSAALFGPLHGKTAFLTALFQGKNHKSPNAGFPEAAFAGAMQMRMGGPNIYHGRMVDKPYIGSEFKDPAPDRIQKACELMMISALVSVVAASLILWGIKG
ncbi:MAG: cobalamin biosynthesis protein CobD [Desulfobacter sp.]|nr:cobalamin biosynthesis protein CobD [Desulfobacter sp.]